jgi:hypothetical protein
MEGCLLTWKKAETRGGGKPAFLAFEVIRLPGYLKVRKGGLPPLLGYSLHKSLFNQPLTDDILLVTLGAINFVIQLPHLFG